MSGYTTVSARLDADLKHEAERVLATLGLSHSAAINALYAQIVLQQGIPFDIKIPSQRKASCGISASMKKTVQECARRYKVGKVWVFGSRARGDMHEGSDLDLLIEKGELRGLELGGFVDDVSKALGLPVDVMTTGSIPDRMKESIERDKVLLYEG